MYSTSMCVNDFHHETQRFFKDKRVAVTGGSGFIGSHLVEQLILLNAKPIVLTRKANPAFLMHIDNKIETRLCDLVDYSSTLQALQGVDVVINLAAVVAGLEYNAKHPASIYHANTQLFLNIIRATVESGIEYFTACSSACVYPRHCSLPTPEEEGMRDEPEPTNSGYGWAKRMQEYLAIKYAEEYGLKVAIPRPYNGYGPRDNFDPKTSHVIPSLIHKAILSQNGLFEVWGDGNHSRSFLYVDDFARGILEVTARYHCHDPINVGANEEVSIADIAHKISEIIYQTRNKVVKPIFNKEGLTGQPRRKCDTTKINRILGYQSKMSFDKGLMETIKWYYHHENENRFSHSDV